jgi:D-alanyl-D-alanine carboxypeptidase
MMGGSNCARGAASQVISKWVTIKSDGNFIAATVAGGTASVITGGKFASGAQTAAFGYLFNYLESLNVPINEKSKFVIALADDKIAANIEAFFDDVRAKGIDLKLNDAFRTNGLQAGLTGNSNGGVAYNSGLHEAGFAFDVNWGDLSASERKTVLKIAAEHKFQWGGNFKTYDPVHFYSTPLGSRKTLIKAAQDEFWGH